MDSDHSEALETYGCLLDSALDAWSDVFGQISLLPKPGSYVCRACSYVALNHPDWDDPWSPFNAGRDALLLFDAGVDYVRAVRMMIGEVPLFPAMCPILRASWEHFGRAAWILAPEVSASVEGLVARFRLERFFLAHREIWTRQLLGEGHNAQEAIDEVQRQKHKIEKDFPGAEIKEWKGPSGTPKWTVQGQSYPSLADAVNKFGDLCLASEDDVGARKFYRVVSETAHPNLHEIVRMKRPDWTDDGCRYQEHPDRDSQLDWLHHAVVATLKVTELIARYFGLDATVWEKAMSETEAFETSTKLRQSQPPHAEGLGD